jgi:hypothetical protein
MLKNTTAISVESLFISDQKDRKNIRFDKKSMLALRARDEKRRRELGIIMRKKHKFTAEDFYMIAMLYQHGSNISDYKKAVSFARRSMKIGFEKAKWLFAAATDRLLMNQGKKQRFGTQYLKKDGKWTFHPVNPKTTDKERAKYNVPALQKAIALLRKLNRH